MSQLQELEERIKESISRHREWKGRGVDHNPEYRSGWCDALESVLKRISKMSPIGDK